MNNETIILNLKERFSVMEHSFSIDSNAYTMAKLEYADLLGSSEEISQAIKDLSMEDEINDDILQIFFNYSSLKRGMRNTSRQIDDPGIPKFWDKAIEKKFKLMESYVNSLRQPIRKATPAEINKLSFKIGAEQQSELFRLKIVNNKIIARLSFGKDLINEIKFDERDGLLYVNSRSIKLKKFGDEYHILRILFENPQRLSDEWLFSEISEKYDFEEKYPDKKFSNAFGQLKQKLKTINITDLFYTTTQSVKINKKYLS